MGLYFILFAAGVLTILLPCILPLIPIVLGVSVAGKSKWRPLFTVLGMLVSFVGFTFLLLVVLRQFVEVADYMRIGTYYVLLLFGLGFMTHRKSVQVVGALAGGFFFLNKGPVSVAVAMGLGVIAMYTGGRIAVWLQGMGSGLQGKAREELGRDNPVTAFIMGLTMGLVWVPCAGPALGFAFTLVREQPGLQAFLLLTAYGAGTAVPLLLIGYGGQTAVHSVRALSRYSGYIKQVAGVLLIFTAIAFQLHWFTAIEIWLVENTSFGTLGTRIEERFFQDDVETMQDNSDSSSPSNMDLPVLPKISRAPEFAGLGPWHNSEPFSLADLKGKVVLVDFWTYSCINCIRTLPYIQGYGDKFGSTSLTTGKDRPFVLLGVHTPEFVFEKSEQNVAEAIKRHGLTYPIAQDNDYETWKAFANRYWPAKYLIDAEGYIRYTHFGEGDYDETDKAIQSLLAEIGALQEPQEVTEDVAGVRREQTPETYMGTRSWPTFANAHGGPDNKILSYEFSGFPKLHQYALTGKWQLVDGERQVLRGEEGEIRMKFLGSEINLVLGMELGFPPATVDVEVDGEHVKSFAVEYNDLYSLYSGEYGEHEITLRISGEGLAGYAFTFGSS